MIEYLQICISKSLRIKCVELYYICHINLKLLGISLKVYNIWGGLSFLLQAWPNLLKIYNMIDARFSCLPQCDKGLSTFMAQRLRHSNVLLYVLLY